MINSSTLEILFEDAHIIVCKKLPGVATQSQNVRSKDMVSLIKRHIYQTATIKKEPYLAVIHRLDQPVCGVLVFAKTPTAAKDLNKQLQQKGFGKHYKALLTQKPSNELENKPLVDYLKKDSSTNSSMICSPEDPLGKKAILQYQICPSLNQEDLQLFSHCNLQDLEALTLVHITLDTGRHHQIRVQMSNLGCPILGDTKYGNITSINKWENIALCAYKLEFKHPITSENLTFYY